jgi:hypothetical protein
MRFAPLVAVATALAILAASLPAEAQTERARTKLTVKKRSYLDAGTTVKPGSAHYHDYVLPQNYHHPNFAPFADEGCIECRRWPLPRLFEIPGF